MAQAVAAAATSATASAALGGKLKSWGVLDIPGPGNPVCAYSARCAPESQLPWWLKTRFKDLSTWALMPACIATILRPELSAVGRAMTADSWQSPGDMPAASGGEEILYHLGLGALQAGGCSAQALGQSSSWRIANIPAG